MGPKGAVEIIFRADAATTRSASTQRAEEYARKFVNPFVAGHRGFIDDVIMPRSTRKRICRSLSMLRDKRLQDPWRKHNTMPL